MPFPLRSGYYNPYPLRPLVSNVSSQIHILTFRWGDAARLFCE